MDASRRCQTEQAETAEKEYDFYGKVVSVDRTSLIVSTKHGIQRFVMDKSTVKGSDFGPGALVHVYYKHLGNQDVVTMVFQKIKNNDEVKPAVN